LIDDGETGYLVPREDANALGAAVTGLLRNDQTARRIGERARARVAERFTTERLVADTERLYASLLAKRGIVTPWSPPDVAIRS